MAGFEVPNSAHKRLVLKRQGDSVGYTRTGEYATDLSHGRSIHNVFEPAPSSRRDIDSWWDKENESGIGRCPRGDAAWCAHAAAMFRLREARAGVSGRSRASTEVRPKVGGIHSDVRSEQL